ncbi:hypothetical protein SUGI_0795420 [Cryptomeria japonica]|uniref:disease resistance protein Roq1 n=1 Tax=Cryptomeria japonica TaxID=3369 RepID=UPI0024147F71|nr:disease resistance protein Roq1 [Cryptomeria japonica]GLJ39020.1 hypothetical protein SUGI_0795420 [Cryptomeria japonica]
MASTSAFGQGEQKRNPFLALEPPNEKIKSSVTPKRYDVFINHRGPDVKTTLARQLYDSLQQAGIQGYLDDPETELGDYFPSAIKNAISSATVHIAILSPRYAESAWCLAELVLMFQTRARIIPLFYHVQPSDFRYIKNGVADAFSKHEEKGRYPRHDIQQWKECLQNVSGIKGYELNGQNDDPNKLCDDVVYAVIKEKQKRKNPFQVAKYEVGLDEIVKDFHSHCQRNGQMRDKIIGIFGMGGSGKTTLAKYLFNHKHSKFSGSTILFDVRENDVKDELTSLQGKLLHDLFHENHHKFLSIEDGIAAIKDNLEKSPESKFLVVIDDVDHQKQLDALLSIDSLNQNSLIIVTTRDERLLIQAGVRVRYKMKAMNAEHSRELFCWHAFHRQSCKSGFENMVDSFVQECRGLPLALQVMGGHVFGSDKAYWSIQLDVVKEAKLHRDIKHTLKISYDALEEDEKQIFMDIACFFIGKKVSQAISIWKASGWRAEYGLQTLKDKCLVEEQFCLDLGNTYQKYAFEPAFVLVMHDHLQDLGREMADNEMTHPRRLWRPEDLVGIQNIKGLQNILTEPVAISFRCSSHIEESGLYMAYFLESSKTSTNLQWIQLHSYHGYHPFIPEWIPLQNLHTLSLEGVSPAGLSQREDQVPLKFKELYCSFQETCFSDSNHDMFVNDLNELVSSLGRFKHVKSLRLEFGSKFLEWNIEWNSLLKSVRELTNLKTLELTSFKIEGEIVLSNRGETTDDRFHMRSLEAIALCGALETTKVSISGQFCPTLKSLKLYSMKDLIEVNLTGVTTLECLVLLKCRRLRKVLGNDLSKLEMFRIKLCWNMRELPNFGCFSCLKRIYISRCRNLQDISAIETLKGLKRIWISYCPELKSVKAIENLKGLKRIWIQECTQLRGVICWKELRRLKRIFIGDCPSLQNIKGIEFLICLESIIIANCLKLQNIKGIEKLKGLKEMIIADSPIMSCVNRLQRLPWELTILVGRSKMPNLIEDEEGVRFRSPMSYFSTDKIGNALSMADAFCETDWEGNSKEQVEEMIHSFHKTQHSLTTFIFFALLYGSPHTRSDICNGSNIILDSYFCLRHLSLCFENTLIYSMIYTCVVNEERLSKYESWMPKSCKIRKAYLIGVKAGEERKTLHIMQSLSAQLYVDNSEYAQELRHGMLVNNNEFLDDDFEDSDSIDYDDLVDYVDDEEEYDDGDYNDNVSEF